MREAIEKCGRISQEKQWNALDVGCATGFLLNCIQEEFPHANVTGVEPSPYSCAKAQKLYGIDVQQGTMTSFRPAGKQFDLVTIMGNLQLHENPFETLDRCHEVLNEEGLLIYEMKNPRSLVRTAGDDSSPIALGAELEDHPTGGRTRIFLYAICSYKGVSRSSDPRSRIRSSGSKDASSQNVGLWTV